MKNTISKRSWIIGILTVLIFSAPFFYCLYVGITDDYIHKDFWKRKLFVKCLEIIYAGLSEFTKEVAVFSMSLVLGSLLILKRNTKLNVIKTNLRYLFLIPLLFIYSTGMEKVASKAVSVIRAKYIFLQEDITPTANDNMDKTFKTKPPGMPKDGGNP